MKRKKPEIERKKRSWELDDEDEGLPSEYFLKLQADLEERERIKSLNLEKRESAEDSEPRATIQESESKTERGRCFLDIQIAREAAPGTISLRGDACGRIEIETFDDLVPKTAANFRAICSGYNDEKLCYKSNIFHRIVSGFMAQV